MEIQLIFSKEDEELISKALSQSGGNVVDGLGNQGELCTQSVF